MEDNEFALGSEDNGFETHRLRVVLGVLIFSGFRILAVTKRHKV